MFLTAHGEPQARTSAQVAGYWVGKYICGQGITRLDLDIRQDKGNAITATFRFGPLPENPEVPKGSYRMEGTYDPKTRRVKLEGVTWIEYPQNYVMVGLDGRMDADGGRIAGMVPTMSNCSDFEVKRPTELIS